MYPKKKKTASTMSIRLGRFKCTNLLPTNIYIPETCGESIYRRFSNKVMLCLDMRNSLAILELDQFWCLDDKEFQIWNWPKSKNNLKSPQNGNSKSHCNHVIWIINTILVSSYKRSLSIHHLSPTIRCCHFSPRHRKSRRQMLVTKETDMLAGNIILAHSETTLKIISPLSTLINQRRQ